MKAALQAMSTWNSRHRRKERFHRVYKGSHSARQDRVILHLYDLSAGDAKNAEVRHTRVRSPPPPPGYTLGAAAYTGFLPGRPWLVRRDVFLPPGDPAAPSIGGTGIRSHVGYRSATCFRSQRHWRPEDITRIRRGRGPDDSSESEP